MKDHFEWSGWHTSPFAAIRAVAPDQATIEKVEKILVESTRWLDVTPSGYLDDILQEVAGETDIVVQYEDGLGATRYRACYEGPTISPEA